MNAEAGWSRNATNCPTMSHARRESNAGSNVQCVMGYTSQTVYKQSGVATWYGRLSFNFGDHHNESSLCHFSIQAQTIEITFITPHFEVNPSS